MTKKKIRGSTLLEVMVTLVLFSILAFTAMGVFDHSQNTLNWNYHALALQQDLRKSISTFSQELRESSPSSPRPITTSATAITFQIPSAVSGNTVTAWKQITYALANNTLTRTVNGQSTTIGNNIQSVNFLYPVNALTAPRTAQIQITGFRNTLNRTITRTETGQVVLRNP